jgi:DNA-binding NarL/FixJ family response regulator
MPIVDGLNSTKMIRAFEKSRPEGKGLSVLSSVAEVNGRIPIFAVSASLVESEKDNYMAAGFDGWVLKPIDFSRLSTLLSGILDDGVRNESLYVPGKWERGGWFTSRTPSDPSKTQSLEITEHGSDGEVLAAA